MGKQYKAIIEIGPIFDYIYATRKSRDLWGASFLFSYLMGEVARELDKNGVRIKRPSLKEDNLFKEIGKKYPNFSQVHAGTIPDSLYCELDDPEVLRKVKNHFNSVLENLLEKAKGKLKEHFKSGFKDKELLNVEKAQLKNYFRLFYVYSDKDDFRQLEKQIHTRGRIFEFDNTEDTVNTVSNKYERCQLCGDRKAVVVIKNVRSGKKFPDEPLCAICTLKRSFIEIIKETGTFKSTTGIAATLFNSAVDDYFSHIQSHLLDFLKEQKTDEELRKNLIDEIGKKKYEEFQTKIESKKWNPGSYKEIEEYIDYRNLFSDTSKKAIELRNSLKDKIKNEIENTQGSSKLKLLNYQIWFNRLFYSIVAMDADGMGSLLRELGNLAENNNQEAGKLAQEISKTLGEFANDVINKIEKYDGILFYAGGEDLLFMVHPAYLNQVVMEISEYFQQIVVQKNRNEINKVVGERPITISAGAYICHHKHPLKLAIQGAHYQLDQVAKKQPGKNTLAILLYKGGGERANLSFPILKTNGESFTVNDFLNFADQILKDEISIPRGFVYKLSEEYEVMSKIISNEGQLLDYVGFIFSKTRNTNGQLPDELKTLILHSCNCASNEFNYMPLINRLYFLRFITGEGA